MASGSDEINNRPRREREKARNIRIADDLWNAAKAEAQARDEYLSEAIRRFLVRYSARQRR